MLRTRRSRQESLGAEASEPIATKEREIDPEGQLLLADSIGPALLVVLETLAPAERVAFVLHDMFDLPFDEIGPIVGRSEAAARQLASRARRRVRGAPVTDPDRGRQRKVLDAFLAASRDGHFDGLLAVLDPDVVLTADDDAVRTAAANKWGERRACRPRSAALRRSPRFSRDERGARSGHSSTATRGRFGS
jgi:RNA polymerase sigma-70 factor (ECF subfamily)